MWSVGYRIGILVAGFMIVANGCARDDNADSGTLSGVTTTKAPNGSAGNNLGLAVNAEGSPGTHTETCPVKTITIGGKGLAFNVGSGLRSLDCTCTVDGEANGERNKCADGSKSVTQCMYRFSFMVPSQSVPWDDVGGFFSIDQEAVDGKCTQICRQGPEPKFIQECANILDPPTPQKYIMPARPVDPRD